MGGNSREIQPACVYAFCFMGFSALFSHCSYRHAINSFLECVSVCTYFTAIYIYIGVRVRAHVCNSVWVTHLKYQVDHFRQVRVSKVKETDPIYSLICWGIKLHDGTLLQFDNYQHMFLISSYSETLLTQVLPFIWHFRSTEKCIGMCVNIYVCPFATRIITSYCHHLQLLNHKWYCTKQLHSYKVSLVLCK